MILMKIIPVLSINQLTFNKYELSNFISESAVIHCMFGDQRLEFTSQKVGLHADCQLIDLNSTSSSAILIEIC